jgi:hypothetical protein
MVMAVGTVVVLFVVGDRDDDRIGDEDEDAIGYESAIGDADTRDERLGDLDQTQFS